MIQPNQTGVAPAVGSELSSTRTYEVVSDDATQSVSGPPAAGHTAPHTISRFEIRRTLGQGAFGAVYLAYDPTLDREVALKIPRQTAAWTSHEAEEFLAEARIAARLKHRHVITIYDAGSCPENGVFIAMEYVEGETLAKRLRRGKLSVTEAVRLCGQIAEAVHQGHKLGLIHRDLKPSNILLDMTGEAKVCDFGLAIHEDAQRELRGEVSGTRPYMSPEQVRGDSHILDGRSDVWSLGVILYECLNGRRPFRGDTKDEIREEILTRDPKPLRQFDDSLPASLDELCQRCLQRDLDNRLRTALDFKAVLENVASSPTRSKTRGQAALVGASIVLVAVVLAMGGPWGVRQFAPSRGEQQSADPIQEVRAADAHPDKELAVGASSALALANDSILVDSLLGPGKRARSDWHPLASGAGLRAETQTTELLTFGQLQTDDDDIELNLHQVGWTGGIGVFYAHREEVEKDVERAVFEALVLQSSPRFEWQIVRMKHYYYLGEPTKWGRGVVSRAPLGELPNEPLRLRLRFFEGSLVEVAVNGQPRTELVDSPNEASGKSTLAGKFGLLLNNCGGSISGFTVNGQAQRFSLETQAPRGAVGRFAPP